MTKATPLGGRYELLEPLGSGGMAEVVLGRDTRLGRDVAVKILRQELANDPTFIARFRREAQSAASLNHPNIVSVYDTGDEDGVPFIVMEYVEGQTLRDCLRSEGRMLPQRALEITADVCAALEYSHQAGIIHRDIKPGNVMLTPTGTVKVMDFGIARAIASGSSTMTQTAAVIGTAQYLSPEQARGEHVDARSDVYSTGCLLYELLTHQPPFSGDSPVAVAYQHVREDPTVPSQVNRELEPGIDAVVMKALAKNPGNRYQSAEEMREDLLRAAAGRPVRATPILNPNETTSLLTPAASTMVLGTTAPPPGRNRGLAYALLALATLIVFVLAAFLVRSAFNTKDAPSVGVPDVKGMTEQAARQALTAVGLDVGEVATTNTDSDEDNGKVVDQDPLPRIQVESGSKVDITISQGIKRVSVPNLSGMSLEDATEALTSLGLVRGDLVSVDVPGSPGTVTDSNPKGGTQVKVGTRVSVAVISGNAVVPSVVGKTQAEADELLRSAGFQVAIEAVDSDQPPNMVIGQNPPANSKLRRGSTVTIQVSRGPASPTPTTSPTPTDSPSPTASPSPTTPPAFP